MRESIILRTYFPIETAKKIPELWVHRNFAQFSPKLKDYRLPPFKIHISYCMLMQMHVVLKNPGESVFGCLLQKSSKKSESNWRGGNTESGSTWHFDFTCTGYPSAVDPSVVRHGVDFDPSGGPSLFATTHPQGYWRQNLITICFTAFDTLEREKMSYGTGYAKSKRGLRKRTCGTFKLCMK